MTQQEQYLAAVSGATGGASKAATLMAGDLRKSLNAGKIENQGVQAALVDLSRTATALAEIDSETNTAVRLLIASPGDVKAAALTAATRLRQAAQTAKASTGRIEGAYRVGSGSVVTDASLAHAMRAGTTIVYAATEAARQLDVLAGKIKV